MTKILFLFLLLSIGISDLFAQTNKAGEYEYVDLGLSVKWATKNVGASQITDYGVYFAWAETEPKEEYDWTTYKYTEDKSTRMTKYCYSSLGAIKDFIDILEASDDAATYNWGQQWRIPTLDEMYELIQNCIWIWSNNYNGSGKAGFIVRSKIDGYTDNFIFLPAGGHWGGKNPYDTNKKGMYWTSSLDVGSLASLKAAQLYFENGNYLTMSYDRQIGMMVRPVYNEGNTNRPIDYTVNGKVLGFDYVDLGLSVFWATANVGAMTPKTGGDLFSWGEIAPKEVYSPKTYQYSINGRWDLVSKYNKEDGLTILESNDDAATQNWGDCWRTPTIAEWEELIDNCDWELKSGAIYGISKINGNVIILSNSTGCKDDYSYKSTTEGGHYWSANNNETDKHRGWAMICKYYMYTTSTINRYWGMAIRPVANIESSDINQTRKDRNDKAQNILFYKNGKIVLKHDDRLYNVKGIQIKN
jgi:hypothetical protein